MSIHATFVGRLGRDPELRSTNGGTQVCGLALATDHGFGDKKSTTWVNASVWGKRGESAAQYLAKGRQVLVTGEIFMESWTNNEGVEKQSLKMDVRSWEFVGSKDDQGGGGGQGNRGGGGGNGGYSGGGNNGGGGNQGGGRRSADQYGGDDRNHGRQGGGGYSGGGDNQSGGGHEDIPF